MKITNFPNLPFRDQVWRINFEDGRESAFFTVYNGEITAWTDNVPVEIKDFGGRFNVYIQDKLSSQGMAFFFEGINQSSPA